MGKICGSHSGCSVCVAPSKPGGWVIFPYCTVADNGFTANTVLLFLILLLGGLAGPPGALSAAERFCQAGLTGQGEGRADEGEPFEDSHGTGDKIVARLSRRLGTLVYIA